MRPGCNNGPVTRASLDKQPHEVASMFDNVAERYDLTNDVLSLGQDRRWRKEVARAVDARPAQKVLDLAAGTATSSLPFARTGAYVVPCDFSLGMLQVGKKRQPWLPFTAGDATRLPFKDDTFDAVSISFGLRNVQDFDAALREMLRVTRPGGRVVICEFSHPTWAPFRTVYTEYLMRALPPSPARSPPTPTRTSTSPSPSAPGPTSPPWPSACAGPAGRGWRGGTSRAGSWPCTGASRRAETGPVGPVSADDRLEGVPRPVQFAFQPAPARSRHARFAHARPAAALPLAEVEPHGDDGPARYPGPGRRVLPYDVVDDRAAELGPVGRGQQHAVRAGRLARVHGHETDEPGHAHFGSLGRYEHRCHPQRYWQGNRQECRPEAPSGFL